MNTPTTLADNDLTNDQWKAVAIAERGYRTDYPIRVTVTPTSLGELTIGADVADQLVALGVLRLTQPAGQFALLTDAAKAALGVG